MSGGDYMFEWVINWCHTLVAAPHHFRTIDTTFLLPDDFDRAQNMSFSETESSPVLVPLNDPEMQYTYYEGDMMIQESDENKVAMYTAKRWPNGRIPYIMENKFSMEERAAVARGIMILQERTCIRFVPKTAHDYDYVLMKRGPGCAAHVGRIGGQQWVILGDGCYGIETVTHELMHAVGFIHEQSRPDRDDHVEIVWGNIKSSAKRNFKKHEFDYLADHGFPYDLMSVMHYRQYAFSKNRKPTILPKRPVPYLRCRGVDCPSELDIKKINFLYKCDKKGSYDKDFENYIDNDLENEITVDEIIDKGNLDEHYGGEEESHPARYRPHGPPCIGDRCFGRHAAPSSLHGHWPPSPMIYEDYRSRRHPYAMHHRALSSFAAPPQPPIPVSFMMPPPIVNLI